MSNQALNLCEKRYVNLFIILLTHKFCDLVLRLCHLLEIILPIYDGVPSTKSEVRLRRSQSYEKNEFENSASYPACL